MNLYLLDNDLSSGDAEIFTALLADGSSAINATGYDLSQYRRLFFHMNSVRHLSDKPPTIGNELLLSNRASLIITERCSLCSSMVSKPATFYRGVTSNVISDSFTFWFAKHLHNILDESRAEIRYYKHHILTVNRWVADVRKVPRVDIFLGPTNKWFVSEKFVEVVTANSIEGFRFDPIEVRE